MTTTRRRFIALALAVPAAAALSGCTALYRNHGYVPPDDELAQVVVAQAAADLALAEARLAQVAPAWALGLTRRRLATLELGKTLALAGLTAAAALPLGLAVAWVLTAIVNVRAFGWRLPVLLLPGQWAMLLALALGTAVLAAAWPAWTLHRLSPATLLRRFSNER